MEHPVTMHSTVSGTDRHIPLIDMSRPDDVTSEELYTALSTVGFACLTKTDVWQKAHDYCESVKEIFKLPLEEKEKYKKPACAEDDGGWVSVGREKTNEDRPGDFKEAFNMYLQIKDNPERMPAVIDNDSLWDMWDCFAQLNLRIQYLIGLGLQLEDPHFLGKTHHFRDANKNRSSGRVNWYPRIDNVDLKPKQIRCGEHTDYGSVILLYSDSPGLQVKNSKTGEFVDAGHVDGGIFVNIGDLLQMWSGDKLKATVHRVLNPAEETYMKRDRFSLIFFGQPDDETMIETLDGSGKYPPVLSGEWLNGRFQATYDIKE